MQKIGDLLRTLSIISFMASGVTSMSPPCMAQNYAGICACQLVGTKRGQPFNTTFHACGDNLGDCTVGCSRLVYSYNYPDPLNPDPDPFNFAHITGNPTFTTCTPAGYVCQGFDASSGFVGYIPPCVPGPVALESTQPNQPSLTTKQELNRRQQGPRNEKK
jgi:hypothetical protein